MPEVSTKITSKPESLQAAMASGSAFEDFLNHRNRASPASACNVAVIDRIHADAIAYSARLTCGATGQSR